MIDIDDFKHFNDRFGHPSGDLVLKRGRPHPRASHVRAGIDIAARYGGEEFTIVLPNTSRDGAQVVGARLARELSSLPGAPPPHDEGAVRWASASASPWPPRRCPAWTRAPGSRSASASPASPAPAGGPGELVRNADKALYLAKRLGKNRVEVFGD